MFPAQRGEMGEEATARAYCRAGALSGRWRGRAARRCDPRRGPHRCAPAATSAASKASRCGDSVCVPSDFDTRIYPISNRHACPPSEKTAPRVQSRTGFRNGFSCDVSTSGAGSISRTRQSRSAGMRSVSATVHPARKISRPSTVRALRLKERASEARVRLKQSASEGALYLASDRTSLCVATNMGRYPLPHRRRGRHRAGTPDRGPRRAAAHASRQVR